jgi:hypothetical protein
MFIEPGAEWIDSSFRSAMFLVTAVENFAPKGTNSNWE